MRFASAEWPPYSSKVLPDDGVASAVVSAVLKRRGLAAVFDYYPWKRAMAAGAGDPQYAGYMPTWRSPEREKTCYFSTPIASSSTVFAYLREDRLHFASLADLTGIRVGVVAGYANGDDFDAMVRRGAMLVEEGLSDEINIKKLLAGRMRVAVIEKHVLRHLLASGGFSPAERERIVIAENLVKERPVHICFKRTPEGLAQQQLFDSAARELDLEKIERDYLKRIGEDGPPARPSLQ
ncbi:MAG TPA: transporter substrate-binding domain-containing protein [Janthinobacterium sp.]|nr:transporter substrate-binding domain-containing protein [Janthinobacterium sp.]